MYCSHLIVSLQANGEIAKMKRLPYIVILLLVLCALSCTRTSRLPQLVAVDSLLLERPDSALQVLLSLKGEVGGMGRQGGGLNLSSKADRMYYYLLLADACNKCYDTLPSDSILREVADFYDSHGTPNEQMRAHYLLGCAYRDMGEAPQALDCYHDAIDRADTTAADCDYYTLSRVHSQSAALLGEQMLPYQQLEELHLQYVTAMKAKDTLCALYSMEQMASAYDMLNLPDSVISVNKRLIQYYLDYGDSISSAVCNGGIATVLIDQNSYNDVQKYLDEFETQTGFFDKEGNIEKGREIYYGTKGRYYTGVCQYDSAESYFRKELALAEDLNNQEYAFRGLFLLYQKLGLRDSMSKYAQLAYQTTDAHFQEKQSDELRHMQALYNYSRNQSIARQKTEEANRSRQLIIIGTFSSITILVMILFCLYLYRRRKIEQLRILRKQYEHDVEQLEQTKYDLIKIKEVQIAQLVAEKESDIDRLQKRLEAYGQSLSLKNSQSLEFHLAETEIYQRLRYLVMHPREKVSQDEWKQLRETINQIIPGFQPTLYGKMPGIKLSDYDICMLDRLYFSPSEIAMLTGYGLSTITMKRVRLLDKLFHIKGKGEQFDVLIRNIQ